MFLNKYFKKEVYFLVGNLEVILEKKWQVFVVLEIFDKVQEFFRGFVKKVFLKDILKGKG